MRRNRQGDLVMTREEAQRVFADLPFDELCALVRDMRLGGTPEPEMRVIVHAFLNDYISRHA